MIVNFGRFGQSVNSEQQRRHGKIRRALREAGRSVVARLEGLEARRLLTAAQVYVNDNWQITTDTGAPGLSSGDTVQSNGAPGESNVGAHTFGTDAFATVADGVNNVSSGGDVFVLKGNYPESNVVLNKPMTVEGEIQVNATRMTPAAADGHDDSAFNVSAQNGLLIASSGVTISHLTLDGGASHNFRQGVIDDFRNNAVYNNVTIDGVVVKNVYRRGIQLYSSNAVAAPKSTDNVIQNSTVDSVTLDAGIVLFDSDATIANNSVSNASTGIAANTIHGAPNAPLLNVSSNNIAGSGAGAVVGMNMAGLADGSTIGPFNHIDLSGGSNAPDTAMVVQFPNGVVHVNNNQIFGSASDSGIFIFAASDPNKPVDISGNSLSNAPTNQDFDGDSTGIFVTDDEVFFGAATPQASFVNISGNTFSGYTRGIDLFRGSATGAATINATINGNTSTGGKTHIRVFDGDGAIGGVMAIAHIGTDTGAIAGDVTGIEVDGGFADISARASYAPSAAVRIINGGALTVLNTGQLIAGPTVNDGTMLNQGRVQVGGITGVGTLTDSGTNTNTGTLSADYVRQNSLTLSNVGRVTINNNNGNSNVSIVKSLSIAANARLDLTNNDMIYDYTGASPRNTVRGLLQTGYGTGTWGGNGINSSQAQTNTRADIGEVEASELHLTGFDGVPVDGTALILKYTGKADSDIDTAVTLTDFTFLAAHFNQTNTYWLSGDYNYDGTTDLTDFTILASVFGQTFAAPSPAPASAPTRTIQPPLAVDPQRQQHTLFASDEIKDRDALAI